MTASSLIAPWAPRWIGRGIYGLWWGIGVGVLLLGVGRGRVGVGGEGGRLDYVYRRVE